MILERVKYFINFTYQTFLEGLITLIMIKNINIDKAIAIAWEEVQFIFSFYLLTNFLSTSASTAIFYLATFSLM